MLDRRTGKIALTSGLCLMALAGAASADTSPFIGRWHWDQALSTLPPGEPPPKDLTAEVSQAANQQLQWSVTLVGDDGQSHVETVAISPNGEFHQVGPASQASIRLTGDSLIAIFKGPSGQSDSFTCGVSEDRQRMTCNGKVDDGDGKTAPYVDVYDRM